MRLQFWIAMPKTGGDLRFPPVMACLETLCRINEWQLERNPDLPGLYATAVFYQADPPGREDWLDIPTLLARGYGDCKSLACCRVAELRKKGIRARPCIKWKYYTAAELSLMGSEIVPPDGLYLVHVMVEYPDGRVECPSARLGMKGEYS